MFIFEILQYVLKVHDEIPFIQRNPEWDQDAVIVAYLEYFYNYTLALPLCLLQSQWSIGVGWYQWQPGHFAMHVLGSYNADRHKTFAAIHANYSKWWEENRWRFNLNCLDETVVENKGKSTVPLYDIPYSES